MFYSAQLEEALQAFDLLEKKYQAQLAYQEEAERIAKQRAATNVRIVQPVNEPQASGGWFEGLFYKKVAKLGDG